MNWKKKEIPINHHSVDYIGKTIIYTLLESDSFYRTRFEINSKRDFSSSESFGYYPDYRDFLNPLRLITTFQAGNFSYTLNLCFYDKQLFQQIIEGFPILFESDDIGGKAVINRISNEIQRIKENRHIELDAIQRKGTAKEVPSNESLMPKEKEMIRPKLVELVFLFPEDIQKPFREKEYYQKLIQRF